MYAFRRKKCALRTGPRGPRAPLGSLGPLFWPGPPDICQCSQVGAPALTGRARLRLAVKVSVRVRLKREEGGGVSVLNPLGQQYREQLS